MLSLQFVIDYFKYTPTIFHDQDKLTKLSRKMMTKLMHAAVAEAMIPALPFTMSVSAADNTAAITIL